MTVAVHHPRRTGHLHFERPGSPFAGEVKRRLGGARRDHHETHRIDWSCFQHTEAER
jgi:hypothetical protein